MKTDTRTTAPYSRCLEAISLLREGNVINFQHSHSIKPVAPGNNPHRHHIGGIGG
jgi:hypothetical protein